MRPFFAIFLVLALCHCSDDAPPAPVWDSIDELAPSGSSGSGFLSSVWGSSASDVFIVGGTTSAIIHHFDGDDWGAQLPPADAGLLVWVYGFGPTNVYAVGLDGTFIHYDGEQWTSLDAGTSEDLWGIWGRSANDIWIVGGSIGGAGEPVLLHYDGSQIESYGVDESENPLGARALFKVWGIGSKVFAVGQLGLILEYNGSGWQRVTVSGGASQDFISLSGVSESEIVVVGGRASSQIAVYNGASFESFEPSGFGGTSAVFMDRSGEAWVGGAPGYIGRFNTADGTIESETLTEHEVHAMWGDGMSRTYAVGGIAQAPFPGLAMFRQEGL